MYLICIRYTGIESDRLWDIVTCRRNKKTLLSYAIQVQRPDRVDVQGTANMISIENTNSSSDSSEREEEEMEYTNSYCSESLTELHIKWNVHRPFDD